MPRGGPCSEFDSKIAHEVRRHPGELLVRTLGLIALGGPDNTLDCILTKLVRHSEIVPPAVLDARLDGTHTVLQNADALFCVRLVLSRRYELQSDSVLLAEIA